MARVYDLERIHAVIGDYLSFEGKRVLDVGCGDGEYSLSYAADALETVGIDPDGEDIAAAKKSIPKPLRDRVRFMEKSIEEFELPAGSPLFDIVVFSWSL